MEHNFEIDNKKNIKHNKDIKQIFFKLINKNKKLKN